jgi:hypothetical protein
MIIPDANNLGSFDKQMLKDVEKSGYGPDAIETKRFYDKVQAQKKEHLAKMKEEKGRHIHALDNPKKSSRKPSRDYRD